MSNISYSQINLGKMMHNVIHLNPHTWTEESNTFDITVDNVDLDNEYAQSLITIPVMLMVGGALMVLLLECLLCFRTCCR